MTTKTARPRSSTRKSAANRIKGHAAAATNGHAAAAATGKGRVAKTVAARTEFPPALLQRVSALQDKLVRASGEEVRTYLGVGREVQGIIADKATYGGVTYRQLEPLFQTGRDLLRPSYALAERYSDAEIDKLLRLRNPDTHAGLHRAHLIALSRVTDKDKAFQLAEKTVANGWSKKDLISQVQKAQGGKKSQGGRIKRPETLRGIIEQIIAETKRLIEKDSKVWMHPQQGMYALIEKLGPEGPDNETMIRMEEAVYVIQSLSTRYSTMIGDFLRLRSRFTPPAPRPQVGGGGG
jgi:hypothetical protein